jgi:hypothetical protein
VQGAQGDTEGFVGFYTELLAGYLPVLGGFVGVEQNVIPAMAWEAADIALRATKSLSGVMAAAFLGVVPFL